LVVRGFSQGSCSWHRLWLWNFDPYVFGPVGDGTCGESGLGVRALVVVSAGCVWVCVCHSGSWMLSEAPFSRSSSTYVLSGKYFLEKNIMSPINFLLSASECSFVCVGLYVPSPLLVSCLFLRSTFQIVRILIQVIPPLHFFFPSIAASKASRCSFMLLVCVWMSAFEWVGWLG
jgi:hypothetical protein